MLLVGLLSERNRSEGLLYHEVHHERNLDLRGLVFVEKKLH